MGIKDLLKKDISAEKFHIDDATPQNPGRSLMLLVVNCARKFKLVLNQSQTEHSSLLCHVIKMEFCDEFLTFVS